MVSNKNIFRIRQPVNLKRTNCTINFAIGAHNFGIWLAESH